MITRFFAAAGYVLLLGMPACGDASRSPRKGIDAMSMDEIQKVLDRHDEELMAVDGVIGVYVGAQEDSTLCIKIILLEGAPDPGGKIPKTLEGYPVVIERSDPIRPLEDG
jgi:hypothetical protein